MKKIIIIISLILIPVSPTSSATLKEALIQAYNNNTELNAERENLNISKEELNISKSNYLPSVTLSGSKSKEETNKLTNQSGGDATITDVDPTTTSIKLEVDAQSLLFRYWQYVFHHLDQPRELYPR